MFALLSARFRTWLVFAVAVPLGAAGARRLARTIEARRGPSSFTRGLTKAGELGRGRRRRRGR